MADTTWIIKRRWFSPVSTQGEWWREGGTQRFAFSLELPTYVDVDASGTYDDNEQNLSNLTCIPAGRYKLRIVEGATHPIWVLNVPDRTEVRIHIANFVSDIKGCIGIGYALNLHGPDTIGQSTAAYTDLLAEMSAVQKAGGTNWLDIVEEPVDVE